MDRRPDIGGEAKLVFCWVENLGFQMKTATVSMPTQPAENALKKDISAGAKPYKTPVRIGKFRRFDGAGFLREMLRFITGVGWCLVELTPDRPVFSAVKFQALGDKRAWG